MRFSKGNLSAAHLWVLALLLLVPLLVALGKWSALPTSDFLSRHITLTDVPHEMHSRLRYVLFVPMGAMLVVLCRLTLGIRVLGPFRSILLAVAFQITGILLGIIFLAVVVAAIVAVRPVLKAMRLPYFGRVSVVLSLISVIMIATMLLASWTDVAALRHVAYFPIIVLCLTAEGFARTFLKEGSRSALWRGSMTVLVGIVLTLLSDIPQFRRFLLEYPEMLVFQIGCIIAICEYLDLRVLKWLNPGVPGDGEESDDALRAIAGNTGNVAA